MFYGCRGSGIFIVSLPQTACSAILHGFARCSRDRKPLFSVVFYTAETLTFFIKMFDKIDLYDIMIDTLIGTVVL